MISVNVRNSSSDFSSWNSSSHLEHILSNLLVNILWSLSSEKGVVHHVSSSDDLDVIKVMSPDSWEADTAIVHLSGEDFVSEEVVTEKTTVRVSHVVSVSSSNVNQVTEKGVHGVVLFVDIIEMFSVLVDSISTEHVLHELESEVILVFDTWSIIEDTNVGVDHLIISNHEKSWDVDWCLGVLCWDGGLEWEGREVLFNGVNNLGMVNITGGNDDDVLTNVVSSVVVSEVIGTKGLGKISISFDWLSHHVLSVGVEVGVLKSGLRISVMVILVFLANLFLKEFKLGGVELWIANHISEKGNSFSGISSMNLKTESSEFSIGMSSISSSHLTDFVIKIVLGSVVSSSSKHLLEKI